MIDAREWAEERMSKCDVSADGVALGVASLEPFIRAVQIDALKWAGEQCCGEMDHACGREIWAEIKKLEG